MARKGRPLTSESRVDALLSWQAGLEREAPGGCGAVGAIGEAGPKQSRRSLPAYADLSIARASSGRRARAFRGEAAVGGERAGRRRYPQARPAAIKIGSDSCAEKNVSSFRREFSCGS